VSSISKKNRKNILRKKVLAKFFLILDGKSISGGKIDLDNPKP